MRWMDIAWAEQGVTEIEGPQAEPAIVGYFRANGRADVTSDETAWCAAFVGACLARAGIAIAIPTEERLLARAYLKVGTPLHEPRVGALVVLPRGNSAWSGHVGFVVGWTAVSITVLGGNQNDSVSVAHFRRDAVLGYRWPEAPATPAELAKAGSRTIQQAEGAKKDVAAVVALGAGERAVSQIEVTWLTQIADQARAVQSSVEALASFGVFVAGRLWLVLACLGVYYGLRAIWRAGLIKGFRAEDHNTGANVQRQTTEVPA